MQGGAQQTGQYLSMAVDPTVPITYYSYYDALHRTLKCAIYEPTWDTSPNSMNWNPWNINDNTIVQTVDNTRGAGEYTSIALDSSNVPHISYYYQNPQTGQGNLRYATYTGGTPPWTFVDVNSPGDGGWYTSLAFDSTGHPWISYVNNNKQVRCVHNTGTTQYDWSNLNNWQNNDEPAYIPTGTIANYQYSETSIAIGKTDDQPRILFSCSYYDSHTPLFTQLYLVYSDGTSWHQKFTAADIDIGDVPSMAIDSSDVVHLSYVTYDTFGNGTLYHACGRVTDNSWTIEQVLNNVHPVVLSEITNPSVKVQYYTSIAFKSNGDIIIAFNRYGKDSNGNGNDIMQACYATKYNTGGWASINITEDGQSISDNWWIYNSNNPNNPNNPASNGRPDVVNEVGEYIKIATDNNNDIHLSYMWQRYWTAPLFVDT